MPHLGHRHVPRHVVVTTAGGMCCGGGVGLSVGLSVGLFEGEFVVNGDLCRKIVNFVRKY